MLTHNENQLTSIEKLKSLLNNETNCEIVHSTARPTTFINNMPVAESINENPIKAKQRKRSHSPDSEDSEEESKAFWLLILEKETPEMKKDTSISMIDDSYDKIIKNLDKGSSNFWRI